MKPSPSLSSQFSDLWSRFSGLLHGLKARDPKTEIQELRTERRLVIFAGALVLAADLSSAAPAGCGGHGGFARCDPGTNQMICADGEIDASASCPPPAPIPKRKKKKAPATLELKFKPPTQRGQILPAGQKPAPTTLEQSEKDLSR